MFTFLKSAFLVNMQMDLNKEQNGHTYRQWLISILANSTLIAYGMLAGWISPMTKVLQSDHSPTGRPLTDSDLSWIASIFCLTAAVGVHLYTYVSDRFGRKMGVIIVAGLQVLSWLIKFSSANLATLITARVVFGLSAGGCFNIIPIYVKEISQDNIRGLTGSLMMLFQNIGFLLIFILGAYFDYFTVLWIVIWLPFATLLLMLKAPESPSYMVKVGKIQEARSTIAWLRGLKEDDKLVQIEIDNINNEKKLVESHVALFQNRLWRAGILLMMSIMLLTSINGCFAILTYASSIIGNSGVTVSPELQSLSFPTFMIIGGFLCMAIVERYGRKLLAVITNFLIAVAMFGLGVVIYLQSNGTSVPGWLPATLMMVAVSSYAVGAGPVPYIMMSEMFNFQIRAKVLGLIVSFSWFINFLQLLVYSPIATALGTHNAFYIFGVINFLAFLICLILFPETKGRSVEEIEAKLRLK